MYSPEPSEKGPQTPLASVTLRGPPVRDRHYGQGGYTRSRGPQRDGRRLGPPQEKLNVSAVVFIAPHTHRKQR